MRLQRFDDQSAVLFLSKGAGSNQKLDASVTVTTPDGTTIWSATAGSNYCSAVTCSGNFATYPYSSNNAPYMFSSSIATGAGGCEIGIARPASQS